MPTVAILEDALMHQAATQIKKYGRATGATSLTSEVSDYDHLKKNNDGQHVSISFCCTKIKSKYPNVED